MIALRRVLFAAPVLSVGLAGALAAQIPGMPLFTNPRYALGVRIHADIGRPTDTKTIGDITVIQGGLGFALGPVGIDANVGINKANFTAAQGCFSSPTVNCGPQKVTVSALAQLRLYGAGQHALSLSAFGGASLDVTGYDISLGAAANKQLTIPVGAALGVHIPVGFGGLNLWGAPRFNLTRFVNCSGTCPSGTSGFRWAVGADLPIFRILSVRAAYDSGRQSGVTSSFWGVGASIGIGGMR